MVCERLERELTAGGVRVRIDGRTDLGLGRRLTDWELKGVPVHLEIGPRDLAQDTVNLVRRDREGREAVAIADAAPVGLGRSPGPVHHGVVRRGRRGAQDHRPWTCPTSMRPSRRRVTGSLACPGPGSVGSTENAG